jgi:quercetin dioxygenase-like cupin family protein
MKTSTSLTMGVLLASVLVAFGPKTAMAQDMVKVAPNTTKVVLENDRVRVLEVRQKPGEKGAMHSHPASLICPLNTSKAKFTSPKGKTTESELKAGEVTWSEAQTHAVENVGTMDSHVLVIELKK